MAQLRTQIYLEPSQHAGLIREARRLGLSLAGLIRKLVDEHLKEKTGSYGSEERKKAALSLIGLGKSGVGDVSENTEAYLGQAIFGEVVKERGPRYKKTSKKSR